MTTQLRNGSPLQVPQRHSENFIFNLGDGGKPQVYIDLCLGRAHTLTTHALTRPAPASAVVAARATTVCARSWDGVGVCGCVSERGRVHCKTRYAFHWVGRYGQAAWGNAWDTSPSFFHPLNPPPKPPRPASCCSNHQGYTHSPY